MREWLEPDGLGGFASGVDAGPRTRRYHALLLSARRPPCERFVLVNGFDAWIESDGRSTPITSQKYFPNVVSPEGHRRLEDFSIDPWPTWTFRTEAGLVLRQEIFSMHDRPVTVARFEASGTVAPGATLVIRPFLSGRDYHATHHENGAFQFDPEPCEGGHRWRPYSGVPSITIHSSGAYRHDPQWYRNFLYDEESARGLDAVEDLASPGLFRLPLDRGPAHIVFSAEDSGAPVDVAAACARELSRRAAFPSGLALAADAYLVKRGDGLSIIAGYPWFADWGRDSFIAIRGLFIALGRLDEAEQILLEWAAAITDGMVPNRFSDAGEKPEFNSVDASLWYVVAVHDFLRAAKTSGRAVSDERRRRLESSCETIVSSYRKGTHFGIQMSFDGLLACGVPGSNVTWMDAKHGDHAFTPRIGKPVEVQALWLAATFYVSSFSPAWSNVYEKALGAFRHRFWNADAGALFDVVDANHVLNVNDVSIRPNQLLAVGGLPWTFLELDRARVMVDAVERRLLTRLGPRSLAPGETGYHGRYEGGPAERDAAYHQGTVWPWLIGPFVEAWVRVRGDDPRVRREARVRFLDPLLDHLKEAGLGHISEIADGDFPHLPRGCPFQAWSLGEVIRLDRVVLKENS